MGGFALSVKPLEPEFERSGAGRGLEFYESASASETSRGSYDGHRKSHLSFRTLEEVLSRPFCGPQKQKLKASS